MPEEAEPKEPVEACEAGKTFVGERAVEQQVVRFRIGAHQGVLDIAAVPGLEDRKLVQERQSGIGHRASGLETAKLALAGERADHAVAGLRAEQIHALQMIAELQVGHAGVRDALLPAHLELPEIGQMAQHFEAAVGDPPSPRRLRSSSCSRDRRARCCRPSSVKLRRSAEIQASDVIEVCDALEHGVGHLTVRVEARDPLFGHHGDDLVPFLVVERVAHPERIRASRRCDRAAGSSSSPGHRCASRFSRARPSSRIRACARRPAASPRARSRHPAVCQQLRQPRAHLAPGERLLEEVLDALQRRGITGTVGIQDVVRERLEGFSSARSARLSLAAVRVPPCCSSSAATPAAPFASATSSGVRPLPARMFGSAPFSRRIRRRFLTAHRRRPVQRRALRECPSDRGAC